MGCRYYHEALIVANYVTYVTIQNFLLLAAARPFRCELRTAVGSEESRREKTRRVTNCSTIKEPIDILIKLYLA